MRQSRRMSMVESIANVAIGYGISVAANLLVLPAFGYRVNLRDAAGMGLVFTLISIVRAYALRRVFEGIRVSGFGSAPAMAGQTEGQVRKQAR